MGLGKDFKQTASTTALANLQRSGIESLLWTLFVQPHEQIDVEIVIVMHRGQIGRAQTLQGDFIAD